MAYSDPMGEMIRPQPPDIFHGRPPPFPRPVKSCPDIPSLLTDEYGECKLEDEKGYFLWEDVFKLFSTEIGIEYPVHSTKEAVEVVLERIMTVTKETTQANNLRRCKSLSVTSIQQCADDYNKRVLENSANYKKHGGPRRLSKETFKKLIGLTVFRDGVNKKEHSVNIQNR